MINELLIVTYSDVLQQGLSALLDSLPEVTHVKAVKDLPGAYRWIEGHHPKIALLDLLLLGNNPAATLQKIQSLSPETKRVLLVDDAHEDEWMTQHAEAVLIKGVAPSAVAALVSTYLLSSDGDEK